MPIGAGVGGPDWLPNEPGAMELLQWLTSRGAQPQTIQNVFQGLQAANLSLGSIAQMLGFAASLGASDTTMTNVLRWIADPANQTGQASGLLSQMGLSPQQVQQMVNFITQARQRWPQTPAPPAPAPTPAPTPAPVSTPGPAAASPFVPPPEALRQRAGGIMPAHVNQQLAAFAPGPTGGGMPSPGPTGGRPIPFNPPMEPKPGGGPVPRGWPLEPPKPPFPGGGVSPGPSAPPPFNAPPGPSGGGPTTTITPQTSWPPPGPGPSELFGPDWAPNRPKGPAIR